MVVEPAYAPYAPKKAVVTTINRYRERGLPDPVTPAVLEQIGVPGSMAPRTVQALRFLGLINEEGRRLEPFEHLKRATSDEYHEQLAEIVRAAYLPVFTIVNPAEDGERAITDAFRQYEPSAQREKMVALFRGLCEEAGIITTPARSQRSTVREKSEPVARRSARRPDRVERVAEERIAAQVSVTEPSIDYQFISAIIQQLPRNARWTAERRERWLKAMTAAIDLLIEVEQPPSTDVNLQGDDASRLEATA